MTRNRTGPRRDSAGREATAWQVQTAKAKFSEVFHLARTKGPQRITRQGREAVVMLSEEEYERLTARARQPRSLVQFFRESPLAGIKLDLERDRGTGREIEL
ncbi:MAG TPA: type II toxin-antitoxin system Phd/YefM family antitoxin [Acidobacteriaceae bacterium]|nr:type II toxin-antitoxin system Phd/YefM family antitoxin [Acidobacteriaceae bacterium]